MANEPEHDDPAEELKRNRALARACRCAISGGLRYELDFPAQDPTSFQSQTVSLAGCGVAAGLLFTVLPGRKRKVYVGLKSARKSTGNFSMPDSCLAYLEITANVLNR